MRVLLYLLTASTVLAANLPPDHAKRMERGLKLFDSEVAALLKQNCLKCHGGEKVKSDFDMATREAGDTGMPVVARAQESAVGREFMKIASALRSQLEEASALRGQA